MKLCEIEGRITGFEFSSQDGFMFYGEWMIPYKDGYIEEDIRFPYTSGEPKKIDFSKVINRKCRLTVEVIEDEQEKKQESSD